MVKNPVSKAKGSGSGNSSQQSPIPPPIQPEPAIQLPPTHQLVPSQGDPILQEETTVQSTQPPSPPRTQSSTFIGEASHANRDIEALCRTSEPSYSQQTISLDPLSTLASANFCLPDKVLASGSLVNNAINQLLQLQYTQLVSHSVQTNKSLEASQEELQQLQKVLEDTKAQAALDLSQAQENLRNENLQQQQSFELEKKKLEDKMAELKAQCANSIREASLKHR